jgi:ABC-type Co2+ transport system permease subunit
MSLINGLPAHVLLVHVVVVLVPLTALALVVCALWPRGAERLGPTLPLLALVTLVSVPLTSQAGEWLERHVDSDPLVRRHAELGDGMLPWALGLFVLAAGVWWLSRRKAGTEGGARSGPALRVAAAVLSVVVAAGAVVDV